MTVLLCREKNLTLSKVRQTPEYKNCVVVLDKWKRLVDEAVKEIISDLKLFDTPSHPWVIRNNMIGYFSGMDGVDTSEMRGYKTLFAYLKEQEKDPSKVRDVSVCSFDVL